jgi:signal peptidase I
VPRRNLVGRAFLVFWPFSRRWGIADLPGPLDAPTGAYNQGSYRVMYRQ